MKIANAVVLFTLLSATSEPIMAAPHHGFGKKKTTKVVTTTGKLTKTIPVTVPPIATPSAVVSPVGSIVPPWPVLVEIPSAQVTSAGASVIPEITPTPPATGTSTSPATGASTPPATGTPTEAAVASAIPTDGGIRGDDSPQNSANSGGNNNNNARVLLEKNVQDASSKTGQESARVAGQANSLQDSANFINFCTSKQLINGAQGRTPGSGPFCNGIPMGEIPDRANMVSSIITFPTFDTTLQIGQAFDITVKVRGLAAGTFTNPDLTYYAAPQQLNSRGQILGHSHVTVQLLDAIDTQNIPDPDKFEFFKGINDAGDGQGTLKASVSNGFPVAGIYRVCTMTSAGNHQPVLMPVAQRGAQDDCVRFTVSADNSGGNNGDNSGRNNGGNTGKY